MEYAAHIEETFQHLLDMARNPGFKDHAWFRAKELAKECPELYGEMPRRLTEAMRAPKEEVHG